ncbi:MAG: hypothetical protein HQL63_05465 [Magnetococcales bacterium]|nr:hypothetical protein [Magnetococcales bacterium]
MKRHLFGMGLGMSLFLFTMLSWLTIPTREHPSGATHDLAHPMDQDTPSGCKACPCPDTESVKPIKAYRMGLSEKQSSFLRGSTP